MILAKQTRVFLFSILLCLCFGVQKGFAQSVVSAFSYSENDSLDQSIARSSSIDQDVQSWSIVINDALRELSSGDFFTLPLPTGELVEAEVTSRVEHANQDVQLIARVIEGGSIVLTIGNGAVFGSINTESASFSISSNGQEATLVDNQSMLAELDMGNDMMIPPIPFKERVSNRIGSFATPQNTSSSTIDLLVVYSSEFADVFSSPETRINQLVSFSNTSFADSGIFLNLRLVAAVELEFNNSSSVSTHLSNATDGVGDFTSLAQLRNQYGADLVAVLSANISNPFSASGVAWVNGDSADYAFSATRLGANCCDSVFTHEIGHNLGSGHEYSSVNPNLPIDNQCDTRFTVTEYACGYGNNSSGWGTIMSNFSNKAAIGYLFSNTDISCQGSACGIAAGNFEAADNRTSFNLSRLMVADFRDEVITPPSNPSPANTEFGWLPAIIISVIEEDED